jgi:hypothetical protein
MTASEECTTDFEIIQMTLQATHRKRIRNLTLTPCDGEVDLSGEAISFYALQLLIRDVLATGLRIHRNDIRVRSTPRVSTLCDGETRCD